MKVAIVKLSALGDIVHAMVVLQFIKKYSKEIIIDWVVEESYKDLLDCHPDINKVHTVNIKKVKKKKSIYLLFSELSKVRKFGYYDLVIDMQGLIKSAITARLMNSKLTIGFSRSSARESIASIFYNKTFNFGYEENIIERNIALIQFAFQFKVTKHQIDNKLFFLYSNQKHLNTKLSDTKKNILLVPGASFNSKIYPAIKFSEIANKLDANFLVIWGSDKEKALAYEIKLQSPRVTVCDRLSIDSLILLISKIDLLIGPDTGPTHMAWALNIASISLFGPTPGNRNSYATKINLIMESDSKVNVKKINKKDNSIKNINVNEIINAAQSLLGRSNSG